MASQPVASRSIRKGVGVRISGLPRSPVHPGWEYSVLSCAWWVRFLHGGRVGWALASPSGRNPPVNSVAVQLRPNARLSS